MLATIGSVSPYDLQRSFKKMLRDRSLVLKKAFQGLELLENRLCFTAVTFNLFPATAEFNTLTIDQSIVTNNGDTSDMFQPSKLSQILDVVGGVPGNPRSTIDLDITESGFTILGSNIFADIPSATDYYNFGAFLNNDRIEHHYTDLNFNLHSGLIPFTYRDPEFAPDAITSDIAVGELNFDNWGGPTNSPVFDTVTLDGMTTTVDPYNDPADNPDNGANTASLEFVKNTAILTIPFTVKYTMNLPMYYNSGTDARAGNTSGSTTNFVHTFVLSGTLRATAAIVTGTTGAIQGKVFSDATSGADSDGAQGIEDVQVYIDVNNNNNLDSNELYVLTDEDGEFYFPYQSPANNTYIVRHIVPDGYRSVYPAIPVNDVDVVAGAIVSDRSSDGNPANFGDNQLPGTITGNVYRDTNNNGQKDVGENGIFAARVYVDLNNDNVRQNTEPTALTDANGNYTISTVPGNPIPTDPDDPIPAAYSVRHIVPGGLHATEPLGGAYTNVHVGYGEVLTGYDFGDADAPSSISGFVYEDLNGNGTRQVGETLIPNARVYIDTNSNNIFDVGETNVLTNNNGLYNFTGLVAGTYRIRHVVPSGYALSSPSNGLLLVTVGVSQDAQNKNFGVTFVGSGLSGTVFNDLNDNGVRDGGEPGIPNVRVFLDSTGDKKYNVGERFAITDGAGFYSFSGLKPGRRTFYHETPTGFRLTRPAVRGYYIAKIIADQAVSGVDFGDTSTGQISGNVFNDANANGVLETGERGIGPWRVFMDGNANGLFDGGENSVLTDKYGNYIFRAVQPGTYSIREVLIPNFRLVTPKKNLYTVKITGIEVVAGRHFANTDSVFVTGVVFIDRNFDGAKARNEATTSLYTVYDDVDNNGRYTLGVDKTALFNLAGGYYYFNNLSSGVHTIRIATNQFATLVGVNQSIPKKKFYSIKVKRGQAVGGLDFGLK